MKPETKKLARAYFLILDEILTKLSANKKQDKPRLHEAFKAWFRKEYNVSYTSLKDYEAIELHKLIERILIEFSVEYGIYLRQPNDPHNAEDLSLSEYFEFKSWSMDNTNDLLIRGITELPEGYHLLTELDSLQTLRPGKRSRKIPSNLTWKYGTLLYQYSPRDKKYYKKYLSPSTPFNILKELVKLRVMYAPNIIKDER